MNLLSWFGVEGDRSLQVMWEDGERTFSRGERHADGHRAGVLAVLPAAEHGQKDELDGAWAGRPLEFVHERGRIMLVLEDTGSEPLHRLLGAPIERRSFLPLARQTKKALACVLIALAFLVATVSVPRADTLVLAAANTWPTAYLDDGRPTGMLVDLINEAYRRAGHSVEVKLMPWARCLKEAETGEVDGVFSSFKLPERERFLAFSKEALTTQVIVFFARPEWSLGFNGDLAALRDVKIGIIAGTSYGEQFDAAVRDGVLRNVEQTNSIESNLKKLVFGRVDLVPSYRYVALDTARRLQLLTQIREISPPLDSVPTYLAFTKVRDLRKQSEDFDAAMASMKQDGTYDRIIGQYLN
jgi:polar amino acid transport system substrate-binding protein